MKFAMLTAGLALAASVVEDVPLTKKTTRHVLKQLNYQFSFEEFSLEYGKSYTAADKPARKAAFEASLQAIKEHNEGTPKPSWFMGLSEHSDKTEAEWSSLKGLHRGAFHTSFGARAAVPVNPAVADFTAPDSLDWRDSGVVTEVKNQGYCGSCWAHSAVETLESQYAINGGALTSFSTQQVTSCDTSDGGCDGGMYTTAWMDYIAPAGGLATEAAYPYDDATAQGTASSCDASKMNSIVAGTTPQSDAAATPICTNTFFSCSSQDEDTLKANLASHGPVSIAVDASSWSSYTGGVFSSSDCSNVARKMDHAVQLVGYNGDASTPYWIVRNSWTTDWGEDGYIYLSMGDNACGLANNAYLVTVA